ncbi:IS630 family transposase [Myxococcus faecalis]|uniref:IS630 family transposase n=1 Tax=Myxococcus TaxID=32 RepID=UPI001CBF8D97|nr:IS630 family transposase [Myxococcus sp. AS-1-15]BDT31412.1 IS630 family transposase [Myxococcus sp. MH1]BDT31737.1 IS630 family transposase [Myxococcus sp. MH1]BDT33953.1 IS630 family transposase [Myxococcus sp. MH1]
MEAATVRVRHGGAPSRAEKGGLVRRLKRLKRLFPRAVLLVMDSTVLRWFPPLRAAWAPRGEQAVVPITGENAKRTLWGAINPRTGKRVLLATQRARREDFMDFLRALRAAYPGRPLLLVLDRASCHTAQKSQQLAARLGIHLLLLPKQRSELNCMDHLWRSLKQRVSANRQYPTVEQHVGAAIRWVLGLSARDALRKAGCLAEGFWLRDLLENFWRPT